MRIPIKFLAVFISLAAGAVWERLAAAPQAWRVSEVPIAWWAWRTAAPTAGELEAAQVRTLFLRAGQLDYQHGRLQRIRPVEGALPREVALHLVYNATRPLLAAFEQLEPEALAATLAKTFVQDQVRAQCDQAMVAGIQLDLDVPVRLLSRYQRVLEAVRRQLPTGVALSLTGLPSWMESPQLGGVLAAADFWVPQFYGGTVPHRLTQNIPLASAQQVEREVRRARQLGRPFYAGLAAYSYGLLYSVKGELLELRGDLDPALIARHLDLADLELLESRPFASESQASAWRVVYRARRACVLDGLVLRPGEVLVLDVPTAANLRACANAVRKRGGAQLLGLCLFRLPGATDPATLTNAELAAALADQPTQPAAELKLTYDGQLKLEALNTGSASAAPTAGAMSIELEIPPGSIREVANSTDFAACEFWCVGRTGLAQPCSARRANLIRLHAHVWRPGMQLQAALLTATALPPSLPATIRLNTDDGRTWQVARTVVINRKDAQ
jgi:hypothetical protein